MKPKLYFLFALFPIFGFSQFGREFKYPPTPKKNFTYEYHGEKISDPYQWLEDDRSEETKKWVKSQQDYTERYLSKIPYRNKIADKLREIWNYERITVPFQKGSDLFFYKNSGLEKHSVLYRLKSGAKQAEELINPNYFSKDGSVSLASFHPSQDAILAAYQISDGGSDWRKVVVMDVQSGRIIDDTLRNIKFSNIAWVGKDKFYYTYYEKPKKGSELSGITNHPKLMLHQVGTSQSEDIFVFGGDKHPHRYISAQTSDDGRFLIISCSNTTNGNKLFIQDLKNNSPLYEVISDENSNIDFLGSDVDALYFITDRNAPKKKVVRFFLSNYQESGWETIIPEKQILLNAKKAGKYIFAIYKNHAIDEVYRLDQDGRLLGEIKLPGKGTVSGFSAENHAKKTYFSFSNYITPTTVYELDMETGKYLPYHQPKLKGFNPDDYFSEQVFYTSKDGTKIPMIISYKRTTKLNGKAPTILYGYGGFNVSVTPNFSPANIVWMNIGGIYAVPNIRGGGEYGTKWHDGGRQLNKKNVFEDFIAAANYLIKNKYTSKDYLALSGASNGGLLVAATMLMKPDIAKVALPAVGVMDMLRYHLFTAGAGWKYDYGTAEDNPKMFEYLKSYSPVHNVRFNVFYPATLATTADHDDRVVPAHTYKFIAQLQEKAPTFRPYLVRIESRAGHGAGKSTDVIIQETADRFAFALFNMGIKEVR